MQSRPFRRWTKPVIHAGLATMLVSTTAMADDTDVFGSQIASSLKPNLLFVLDYSGSMDDPVSRGNGERKIDILKAAVRQLMVDNEGVVNAGLGSLYDGTPSGVQWPISDLASDAHHIDPAVPLGRTTVREVMSQQLDTRRASGPTATVDALAEAASYFRGDTVYRNGRPHRESEYFIPDTWNDGAGRYNNGDQDAAIAASYSPRDAYRPTGGTGGVGYCRDYTYNGRYPDENNWCEGRDYSVAANCTRLPPAQWFSGGRWHNQPEHYRCEYKREDQWLGAKYDSPIEQQCQINAVILVSDGVPTVRRNDSEVIKSIAGNNINSCENLSGVFPNDARAARTGRCGPEIAAKLATTDQTSVEGSKVMTFTVGFDTNGAGGDYLRKVAKAGEGDFYQANSSSALSQALDDILRKLTTTSQSFTPAAVDVDRANFQHDNRLFYSMFKPSGGRSWQGNLKGYFLGDEGLMDINNAEATEVRGGIRVMKKEAQSFWSLVPDGDDVAEGGASALFDPRRRNLYTYTGHSPWYSTDDDVPAGGVTLANDRKHRLRPGNDSITNEMLGNPNNRRALLRWLRRAPMGDPLHSQPVQISYGPEKEADQTVMYVMTNQGFVHAIDATDPVTPNGNTAGGNELFAFMPTEMLPKIREHAANRIGRDHIYGLDGAMVRWHQDSNNDGIVNPGEKVLLVFGMRRGGKHYYALDVSNPNSPRYMWKIDGGRGDFDRLGETWSRPSLITVNNGGTEQQVLVFGGGYDAATLDDSTEATESRGNAIYMVDMDGNLVWHIDNDKVSDMKYAIPSDLRVVDVDGDRVADRIYVGDLGGQIWRVDIDDIAGSAKAKVLAKNLNPGVHTSFFYPPSVALNSSVYGDFLSVSIGSGNRTNPLAKDTKDRIYMIRDELIYDPLPADYEVVTAASLYNATENELGSNDPETLLEARAELKEAKGWYVNLRPSEKSITQVVTYEGHVLATTFDSGSTANDDPCRAAGVNRFYFMDLATAKPMPEPGEDDDPSTYTKDDRDETINGDGILSSPSIYNRDGGVVIAVDNEIVRAFDLELSRVYWHSQ